MNGFYLNSHKLPTLEEKVIYFDSLLIEHDKKGISFCQIGKNKGLSDVRIRKEYSKAVKINRWKNSDLWNLLYHFTKTYPASYAIRLYGYLLTKNISSIEIFQNTEISDIFSIKGIGIKYQDTILQMKNYIKVKLSA